MLGDNTLPLTSLLFDTTTQCDLDQKIDLRIDAVSGGGSPGRIYFLFHSRERQACDSTRFNIRLYQLPLPKPTFAKGVFFDSLKIEQTLFGLQGFFFGARFCLIFLFSHLFDRL
jgi:hypothetical protein